MARQVRTQLLHEHTAENPSPARGQARPVWQREEETRRMTPIYSVVAPVFNEEETLPHFYRRLVAVLEQQGELFEIVLVNDGSRDGSYGVMRTLHEHDPRVRIINFSRNFGHQIA